MTSLRSSVRGTALGSVSCSLKASLTLVLYLPNYMVDALNIHKVLGSLAVFALNVVFQED
jgi:hypothetical protein